MRRGLASSPPLCPAERRTTPHSHLAARPWLLRQPLHEIVAVALVSRIKRVPDSFRIEPSARIRCNKHVPSLGIPARLRAQARSAIRRHGQHYRQLLAGLWHIHVNRKPHAVAHGYHYAPPLLRYFIF